MFNYLSLIHSAVMLGSRALDRDDNHFINPKFGVYSITGDQLGDTKINNTL